MADASKEIYTGAEGSGAGPYAHWATEKTLLGLCDTLKSTGVDSKDIDSLVDMIGTMSKDGKVDTASLKAVLQNLKQGDAKKKEGKKDTEEHAKKEGQFWSNSKKEAKKAYQAIKSSDLSDQLAKGGEMMMMPVESISEAFVRVAGIVSSVGSIMGKWGKQIIDNIKILGKWGQGLLKGAIGFAGMIGGLATTLFAGLMGAITGLGNAFFQLYNTGINLAGGLSEGQSGLGALASAAADARLTVGEFAEFVGDNARVAVAIGAAAMGQLSGSVRLALYPLGNLGLTAAETNDYLGDWLETQRSIGVLETMSRAQQARGAADYLVTLTELAQVTGRQRKQIADSIKANMQQVEVMGMMLGLPDEMKANVQRVGQSLSGILGSIDPEFAAGFMEALGKGNLNMTEWGKSLKKAGFQAEANAFQGLIDQTRSGTISEEEAKVKMFGILQQMKENKGATARMNRLFRVNDMTVAGHMKMQAALEGANLQLERQDITMDKTIKTIGSWDEMQRSVSQSWTNFMKGLFNDERFTKTMGTIAESLRNLFAPDSAFTKNLKKFMEGFGPKLVDGMAAFGDWIGDVDFQGYIDRLPGQIKSMGDKIYQFIDMIRGLFFKEVETGDEFAGAGGSKSTTWVAKTGDEIMGDVGGAIGDMLMVVFKKLGNIILDSAANLLPGFLRPDTAEVNTLQAELKALEKSQPGGKDSDVYKAKLKELEAAQTRQDEGREFTGTDAAVVGTTAVVGGYAAKKAYNVVRGTAKVGAKVVGALTPGASAATKKVAKEAAEKAAREVAEKAAKEAAEKAAKETAERVGKKAALKVATKVGQRAATIAATSAVGGPFAPLIAVGATIAFAGYDAYRAIQDTANIVGKTEGEAVTLGDKIKAGASGVVSGLTFGMVSAKKVHDTVAGWKFWDSDDDMPATPPGIETAHLKALAGVDLKAATAQFEAFNNVIGPLAKGINSLAVGLIKTDPDNMVLLAEALEPFEKLDGAKLTAVGPGMEAVGKALVNVGWGGLISELADPIHIKSLGGAFVPWNDLDGAKLTAVGPGVAAVGSALANVGFGGLISKLADPAHLKSLGSAFVPWAELDGGKLTTAGPGVLAIAGALDNVGFSGFIAKLADPVHLKSLAGAFVPWADIDGAKLTAAAPGVTAINKSLPGIGQVTAKLTDPVHLKALGGAFSTFADVDGAKLTAVGPGIAEINKSLPGIRDVTANLADPKQLTALAGSFKEFGLINGAALTLAAPGIAEINKSLPGIRDVTANLADPLQLTALAGSFKEFGLIDGAKLSLAAPGIAEINKSLPGIKEITASLTDPKHLKALSGAFKEFEVIDGPKLSAAGPGMKAINDSLPGFGAILSALTDPKHLKALGVGFAEFGKIDGANLKLVAPGVAAIGEALEGSLGGALKSLLGVDSPIDKLASLGEIANPVTLAAEALAKLNPQITTLFNSIGSPGFLAGVNAMTSMKNVLGQLDDNVNDWDDSELKKFKSITESMGQYAQAATGGPTPIGNVESDVSKSLKTLVDKMETLISGMQDNTATLTDQFGKLTRATKQANPFVS